MLKGIDPILSPELLAVLREMGHGDEIAIVDANYPAASAGPTVVRLDGVAATEALDAILSLMPLDDFVPEAAWRMEVVGAPHQEQPIFAEFRNIIAAREGDSFELIPLERFAFYERASDAYAIVSTSERRLYGNVILKKGVIRSEEA
ncbi:RbsD/FucU family protein [Methylovirgula sp. 4M-Z18]|uniref:RbsD/FucU family protein n=1 Tax=Methylovirgula sp. 4M-Z18 TaxID=2293567 RepID=UPI000E2F329E|nr:RbsD/FucU family protein [Methylovirgula sp. 4M-Z18]RFB78140.1 ribose ABC transporter [Methylovirgula sp. 4M-Z18]